ncbi:hypothetical protein OG247_20390 [Streptomyces sp. NBC_01244]|nr:hypothetical protein OG247_20390 [Streptomyces sp. NBC_01244]
MADPLDQGNPDIVLGVDTHKDVHAAALVTAAGAFVESRSFPTTAEGYEQLLDWARTLGHLSRAGWSARAQTAPPSAGICRSGHHRLRGEPARQSHPPTPRQERHRLCRGCSPRSDHRQGDRHPELRASLAGLSNPKLIRACAGLDSSAASGTASAAAAHTLKLLARRIQHLTNEIEDLTTRIRDVIPQHNPQLLACYGVGPDTAATLLPAAGGNPERLRSKA